VTSERPATLHIGTETTKVEIDSGRGGRIAQITFRDVALLVGESLARPLGDPMRWGCYPMVPWAGRVRNGQFVFDGHIHQLPVSDDGHAIHGVGYTSAWSVDHRTPTSLDLSLELPNDDTWPFGGSAHQRISVGHDELTLELAVTAGERPFPAMVGWHPWFRKPDALQFHPMAMYRRVGGIAVDERLAVTPGPWDDCFLNFEPVAATIDGITVRLTSECTEWVVYDEPQHATCIEPQSGPPDAFNTRPEALEPGQTLTRSFRIELAVDGT
jgi:aldose 1-epimerase